MKKIFPVLLLISIMLTGCNSDTVYTPLYNGKNLIIGVIGNYPKVREENVKFKKINFNKIEENKKLSSELDAVFIMKENHSEAANSKYEAVYKSSGIPFFFIDSTKSFEAIINGQLSFEDAPDRVDQSYATGILGNGKYQYCGYYLYNDKVNENNIKALYTQIFTTIESGKCFND
ncbi:hypothetical protein BED47_21830 [Gottfriedia luciferensis]|uniref:Lipoprotein n=1 Tax=Gottfriedia luciferensis TaxID=178774 RepID=A0ABX2ZQ81_9BACI|nr:hypothetical protein [Gottfriedia luciferensis]ODG91768.1 hypothetical protein BED47_21830 [Gottfriedia luciferensis]